MLTPLRFHFLFRLSTSRWVFARGDFGSLNLFKVIGDTVDDVFQIYDCKPIALRGSVLEPTQWIQDCGQQKLVGVVRSSFICEGLHVKKAARRPISICTVASRSHNISRTWSLHRPSPTLIQVTSQSQSGSANATTMTAGMGGCGAMEMGGIGPRNVATTA